MADRISVQSGEFRITTPDPQNIPLDINIDGRLTVQGDLIVIGDSTGNDIASGSLQIQDKAIISNFGEIGQGIQGTPDTSGLVVDRGMFSLIKVPDPDDPDSFPTVFLWEVERDADGNALLRDDEDANDESGVPSSAPATMVFDESSFGWDLNSDVRQVGSNLSANPRIVNLGDPNDENDLTAATTVNYVESRLTDVEATIPVNLEDLQNVLSSTRNTNDALIWNGSAWTATAQTGGLQNVSEDTDPVLGGNLDTNSFGIFNSSGNQRVTLSGINYPNALGSNGQFMQLNGSDLIFADVDNQNIVAGEGLNGGGNGDTVNLSVDFGAGNSQAARGDHGHNNATQSVDGFMSSSDKTTLDNLQSTGGAPNQDIVAGIGLTGGGNGNTVTLDVGIGIGLSASADQISLDTGNNRNLDHSTISVNAGNGLSGGGTIAATRTINVVAGDGIVANANDILLDASNSKNVDHDSVTFTAGNGLSGGGTIAANRTFTVDFGTSASQVAEGNHGHSNATQSVDGFMSSADKTTLDNLQSSGGAPNQDIIAGQGLSGGGNSNSVTLNVGAGTGISVAADTVGLDTGSNRNLDHSTISVSAGSGLTGGGTIATNRTINVGAGTGITVNANDIALNTSSTRNTDHSSVSITAGSGLSGGGNITASRTLSVDFGTVAQKNTTSTQTFQGQITAPSFNTSSSLVYKEDIMNFKGALDKVMQIDVMTYALKDDKNKERRLGVSAESLAKVVPELVGFKDGRPDNVNYAQGFALLTQAIQEQENKKLLNRFKRFLTRIWSGINGN